MKHDQKSFQAASGASYASVSDEDVKSRVRRFLPLVHRTAWHLYGAGREGMEIDDLIQTGIMALTECAQRHNGPGEDGFAAYAKIRVRGAMLDQIRKLMNSSRTMRKRRASMKQACADLRGELGRDPTRAEIAGKMQISDHELLEIESSEISIGSINEEYDDANGAFASDDPDPFDCLSSKQDRERLIEAMSQLPDRSKLVLQLFFVEEMNLTEIAAVIEVSVPRVHQLRAKALKDLRALVEGSD